MITLESFESDLKAEAIDRAMEAAYRAAVVSPEALYLLMQRFVRYSRTYSFMVPVLASVIGESNFFHSPTCSISAHAERSMDVAAKVFSASVEEFHDPKTGVSHRTLAYGLLDQLAEYANLSTDEITRIAADGDWILPLVEQVRVGYQADPQNLESLVEAIGFHVATETIGGHEFSIMNSVLFSEQRHTAFGQFVRQRKLEFGQGTVVSPWYWIVIHGTATTEGVELEHSADALLALNLVVQYTDQSEETIIEWAGRGFARFATIQQAFFQRLLAEVQQLAWVKQPA